MRLRFAASLFAPVLGCVAPVNGVPKEQTVLRFVMRSLQGEDFNLADYEGKVLMIVNVASNCGYNGQYEQLQKLH